MTTLIKKRAKKGFAFSVSQDLPIGVTGLSIKDVLESEEKRGATVVGLNPEELGTPYPCSSVDEVVAYIYDSYRLGEEKLRLLFIKVGYKMWIGKNVDELLVMHGKVLGLRKEAVLRDVVKVSESRKKEVIRARKKEEISKDYIKSA
jgi:hypothetical protein